MDYVRLRKSLTPVAPRMTILGLGNLNSLLSTPGGGPRPSAKPARIHKARKALRSHILVNRTFQLGSPHSYHLRGHSNVSFK